MGWMRSNIALREGRYVTWVQGTLVDVRAGGAVALIASVARACKGADVVGARRVGVAVVGPICDRGARPVTPSVAPKRVRAN